MEYRRTLIDIKDLAYLSEKWRILQTELDNEVNSLLAKEKLVKWPKKNIERYSQKTVTLYFSL